MNLKTEAYESQTSRWPSSGRVILAQFDAETVVVYQAFRPELGRFAATHGFFGGGFSLSRMSWVKTNFLWMMFRCGWGTRPEQETTLAVRIKRRAFEELLRLAVPSTFDDALYGSEAEWRRAGDSSTVRLQWDPDHDPSGAKVERRAIQLGLRGVTLEHYAKEWIVAIDDLSDFVAAQRTTLAERGRSALLTPREEPYPVADPALAQRLRLSSAADRK